MLVGLILGGAISGFLSWSITRHFSGETDRRLEQGNRELREELSLLRAEIRSAGYNPVEERDPSGRLVAINLQAMDSAQISESATVERQPLAEGVERIDISDPSQPAR